MRPADRLSRKIFLHLCSKMDVGCLKITTPNGRERVFGSDSALTRAEMNIWDESLYQDLLSQGDWGLGWAYVQQKWGSKSPRDVSLVFMLNEHVFKPYVPWATRLSPGMRAITRQSRANQRREGEVRRRTISECYDVGNDFFQWVLGPSMTYTCAIWPHPEASLEEAQENKIRILTQKARIEPQHSVLEMGCGWGTLCNHIQQTTHAKVKGIALAREQIRWAKEHYPNCEFEYLNYDNATGTYDRIVSVGMAEHVGRENLDDFMRLVCELLVPGGRFVMHTMCSYEGVLMLSDRERWTSFASVVMPNGDVPSMANVVKSAMNTGMMRLVHSETFGVHYARTGKAWLDNLVRNKDRIVAAYSEELYRTYFYSWSMGSAAFETGLTLAHFVFEKKPFGSPLTHSLLEA
jgi:cyclopropane-fatty-acyl-phospholipid synthase